MADPMNPMVVDNFQAPAVPPTTGPSGTPTVPNTNRAGVPTPAIAGNAAAAAPDATGPGAKALRPSPGSGVHGVLAGMLMGALSAVGKVAKGVGHEWQAFSNRSPEGQARQMGAIERQQKTQQMQIEKQKAQQESVAAMDKHTEDVVRTNGISLDNAHKVLENERDTALYPDMVAESRLHLMDLHRTQDAADRDFASTLEAIGFHVDQHTHETLTDQQAMDIATGRGTLLSNGKTGKEAGYGFVSNDELKNTPLPAETKVLADWKQEKDGSLTPIYQTLMPGANTGWDLLITHDAAMKKFNELQAVAVQNAKAQNEAAQPAKTAAETANVQAEAKEHTAAAARNYGEANKANAEAKLAQGGITDANKALTGQSFINTLPPAMQDGVNGLLRYQIKPSDLGRGQQKLPLIEAAVHADPTWSQAKYNERYQYLQEYGTSKSGDGATRSRINTAVGHLDMLAQASQALDQNNLPVINQIANTIGVAAGSSAKTVYDAIAQKAASEAAGAMKGGGTAPTDPEIDNTMKSFSANAGSKQRMDNIRAQYGLIATQVGTITGKFQETMGQSPEEFGQPVLYGGNDALLKKWTGQAGGQVFNSQKWAAANPGKDVNAAIAAARAQGMEVK